MTLSAQHQLIEGLITALRSVGEEVEVRETHISWVLLFGDYALKIKKAVNFGFLDFSSLEKRKQACLEELRLNRRYAPQLYLGIVSIGGNVEYPLLDQGGPAIEYGVRMQRFDESGLLSYLAEKGSLRDVQILSAADRIAAFHRQAPVAPRDSAWGKPEQVHRWLQESIRHIDDLLEGNPEQPQINRIESLCSQLFAGIHADLAGRNRDGFVRECHGDLHLGNMVWLNGQLVPFDCIEFNPGLRWIDVMSEAAFVMMDLEDRGYPGFAWLFINRYLSASGDYPGLHVLRYYLVYRALVRAKVTLLQRNDPDTPPEQRAALMHTYLDYARLAQRWLQQRRPVLLLMHGLSASGKSTIATQLATRHRCIHLRSDVERKRLHGLEAHQKSHAGVESGIYSREGSDRTYQHLLDCARIALQQGYPVIVDAAFLQRARREAFARLAQTLDCPWVIVHCAADQATLEQRLVAREQQGHDPSEATLAVLHRQIEQQDALQDSEPWIRVSERGTVELPVEIRGVLDKFSA